MQHIIGQLLFWVYWCLTGILVGLFVRELWAKQRDWKLQATAMLAIIPLLMRFFLLK